MGNETVQLSKKEEEGKEREKVRGGGTLSLGPTTPPLIERKERERERGPFPFLHFQSSGGEGRTRTEGRRPPRPLHHQDRLDPRSLQEKKRNYHNNSR